MNKNFKKKSTMNDVAKLAGVSQSTVSFVINNTPNITISEEVKRKVYNAIEQLNFTPRVKTQNYCKVSDNTLALFIPNVSNLFYPALIKSVDNYALLKGFRLIIINTNRNEKNEDYYFKLLSSIKIAGIIYGFNPSNQDICKLNSTNIPTVIIGESLCDLNVDIISLNSFRAGEMIAQHLYELGHKKIAFISSPINSISLSRKSRLDGIHSFFENKNDVELQVIIDNNEYELHKSNYELEIGYNLTKKLLGQGDVTAIIGANDMIAFGIFKALNEYNIRIPQDISVCGFDNIVFSSLISPPLTTVDHCTDQRCRLAIDILEDKITGKVMLPMKINYEPLLIKRDSTCQKK